MPPAPRTTSSTARAPAAAATAAKVSLRFKGAVYDYAQSETVLEALLRQGVPAAYSCANGVCLTCMLRCSGGTVPAGAQEGLKDTLRATGHFLPCVCFPRSDLDIVEPSEAAVYGRAEVLAIEKLSERVCRVTLEPANALYYRAGQFVNLRRGDGLIRSYSLASVPALDGHLELHVKCLSGGAMSPWIYDDLRPGDSLDLQGPNGDGFYLPGRPDQPLLLVGNGTGLAPLMGIARDALNAGHRGPIRLYHGSRSADGLYLVDEMRALAARHPNLDYQPCVSRGTVADGYRAGRAEEAAFADQPDLKGWRIFFCGYPPMVHAARKKAYLSGADLNDIHADPFELRDLRTEPRP